MADSQRAGYLERLVVEQAALIVSLREMVEFQAARIAVLEKSLRVSATIYHYAEPSGSAQRSSLSNQPALPGDIRSMHQE